MDKEELFKLLDKLSPDQIDGLKSLANGTMYEFARKHSGFSGKRVNEENMEKLNSVNAMMSVLFKGEKIDFAEPDACFNSSGGTVIINRKFEDDGTILDVSKEKCIVLSEVLKKVDLLMVQASASDGEEEILIGYDVNNILE